MTRILWILFLLLPASALAQSTTFVPTCQGTNDTAAFSSLITTIGSNQGTIRIPYKSGTRCAVNTLTIPANVALDNTGGTGIKVNSGQVLTVLGPVVNPVLRQMFFGPGSVTFAGNIFIGTNGQSLLSDGAGGTSWGAGGGGGGGGDVSSVFNRTGAVTAVFGDYTWALIDKTTSSLADITFHSANELSNGTTGTGPVVLRDSPTLVTPVLGVASATSINNLGLAGVSGKTLTVNNTITLAATSDGFTFTVPGTGTGVLDSRTITEGAGLAGNTYDLSANRTLAMGVPSNVSVSSTSSASGTTHSHGVNSSSNPGAAASILATDASGFLQLTRLGIGITPTQPLEVNGNVFISASTANLFLKDTSTGWQSASTTVVTPQNNNCIRSTNFTTSIIGWNICAAGDAEFANVRVRGAISSSIFTFNSINATAGTLGVYKSAAKLRSDVAIPAGPAYGVTTVSVDVVDPEGLIHAASQIFTANDVLRLKDGVTGDTWLKVVSASDQTTFWRYTATIMAGTNNVTFRAGLGVPDYGPSGAGFIEMTADRIPSPYQQMATHVATFTSTDANGTLILTPRTRTGNLNGSYGYASDIYGFATGQYGTAGQSWMTAEATNGIRLGSNTTPRIQLSPDGSGFLANSSISWSAAGVLNVAANATIAGWSVNSAFINSGTTYLASNFDIPIGQVAWIGKSTSGQQGYVFRDASDRAVASFATNSTIFPYTSYFDGTRFRVVIGGLNNAWGSDGSTNSMGMKIWDSAGNKLVEFSDVQNKIAGWTIGSDSISAGGITMTASTGTVSAGSGSVLLDSNGISVITTTTLGAVNTYKNVFNGNTMSHFASVWQELGSIDLAQTFIQALSTPGSGTYLEISGNSPTGTGTEIVLLNSVNGARRAMVGINSAVANAVGFTLMEGQVVTSQTVNSGAAPIASAALDVRSTTGAFIPPRMSTTQKNALSTSAGMVVFDTDLQKLQVFASGAWVSLH